ncbi:MAG TPA: PhnD/SsuA/transferrin family substrate-binding protein [Solirubrobacterales bacterium]|nr:PhnD/SsuA/transferrin family substrate-binding protein [Solirubrobacterales bacterium]
MAVKPSEVFTPAGAVAPGMFATRASEEVERRLADALEEPGFQVALYGWTGVGKTSLVDHLCGILGIKYLKVDCGGSSADVMSEVLSVLDIRVSKEVIESTSGDSELHGGAGRFFGGKLGSGSSSQELFERYGSSLEKVVVDALVAAEVPVLFLDNLEDLEDGEANRQGIRLLMKKCSDRNREPGLEAPKVIVAGPPGAVEGLLRDETVLTRTRPVGVPQMPTGEMEEILVRGAEKLEMAFDDDCRQQIAGYAEGFPHYVHLFALDSCRVAIRDGRSEVTLDDFRDARDQIVDTRTPTLSAAYRRATWDRGLDRSSSDREGVLAGVARDVPAKVSRSALHADLPAGLFREQGDRARSIDEVLTEFCGEFGILEDVELEDGSPGYRFRDPMMPVYVRLRARRSRREAADTWVSSLALPDGSRSDLVAGDSGMRAFARDMSLVLPVGERPWQVFLERHGLEQVEYDDIDRMGEDLAAEPAAIAFVPAGAFIHLRGQPYEPVATALAPSGEVPELTGLLVVSVVNDVTELGQLRGARLASTGRFSTTSYLGPALLLHEQGESIHDFFETVEGFAVGGEVEALLRGYADVAMVEEKTWESDPSNRERTRVIGRCDRLPAPLLIAATAVDEGVVADLAETVLGQRSVVDGFSGFAPCRREDLEEFFAEADAALARP